MPYSISDQSNLPANVKKLSAKKRRQWVHVWNSAYQAHSDEGKAFAMANAAVKGVTVFTDHRDPELPKHVRKLPSSVARRWVSSHNYHIMDNGDPEAAAAYADENTYMTLSEMQSMMGKSSKAADDEMDDKDAADGKDESEAAGVPAKTHAKKKELDMQSSGGSVESSWMDRVKMVIKSALGAQPSGTSTPVSAVQFFKQADDRIRMFTVYSNCFKDKHKEILPEAAHKEYVAWADANNAYPEMQLWHCGPGSRFGQIDFVDYVDGFAIASGLVDADKEYIAEALQKQDNLKVSHGFYGIKSADGQYLIYRPFEISVLPGNAAANAWTAVSIGSKEYQMPLSDVKKAFLKGVGMSDEQITAAEGNLKQLGETLKAAGVEFKEDESGGGDAAKPDSMAILVGEMQSLTKAVTNLAGVVTSQAKELGEVKAQVTTIQTESAKSIDQRVEESLTARVTAAGGGAGYRATESAASALTKEQGDAAKQAAGGGNGFDFGSLIDGQVGALFGMGGK